MCHAVSCIMGLSAFHSVTTVCCTAGAKEMCFVALETKAGPSLTHAMIKNQGNPSKVNVVKLLLLRVCVVRPFPCAHLVSFLLPCLSSQAAPPPITLIYVRGENETINVKRLPKIPAPPRFGRKLTEGQKALATHVCVDCGYVYTDP